MGTGGAQSASQTIDDLQVGLELTLSLEVASLNKQELSDGTEAVIYWNGVERNGDIIHEDG